jgi:hypothetical protein
LLTLDAYTEATGFYRKNGFQFFEADDEGHETRAMYSDLARPLDGSKRI